MTLLSAYFYSQDNHHPSFAHLSFSKTRHVNIHEPTNQAGSLTLGHLQSILGQSSVRHHIVKHRNHIIVLSSCMIIARCKSKPPPSLASRKSYEPCQCTKPVQGSFRDRGSIRLTYRWNCGDRERFKSSTHGSLHIGGFFPHCSKRHPAARAPPNQPQE
ncbi:hypothetical protein BDW67DRAFT_36975 [Aspergillus spinulosporus]